MNLVKVISTEIDNLNRRLVKFLRFGKSDVQTSLEAAPFGVDSNPIEDMVAIYAETGEKGKTTIIGYLNKNQLAEPGETRLYSTDDDGEQQFYIWLRKDGTVEIGGDTKHMVRYEELQTAFDELKSDFNTFITIFNNHVHSGVAPGPGLTSFTTTTGSPSAADITPAKIDEIKCL